MLIVAISLPRLARSQAGPADTEEALMIPLHPSTPTTVQLPDAIVDARILHRGEFLFEAVGRNLNLRPRPDTPAGTEAVVEVETRTLRRRFRVRVVERPEDAVQKIVLSAVETSERTEEAQQAVPPVVPAEPEPTASPPASAPTPPAPVVLQPQAGHEPAPEPARESAEPATMAATSPAFDLSVHALVSLGITALDVPGYEPGNARQPHGALGLRLTLAPQARSWALEASVSGERLAGAMAYVEENLPDLAVRSTWFRAEVGLRAWAGTRWMPTVYAGLGFQAHLRTEETTRARERPSVETMEPGAVLTVGMGLQYRAGDVLLGIEFQGRQGVPDDYFSIAALWTVGRFLDQGD
jgi:hypothetical protein